MFHSLKGPTSIAFRVRGSVKFLPKVHPIWTMINPKNIKNNITIASTWSPLLKPTTFYNYSAVVLSPHVNSTDPIQITS